MASFLRRFAAFVAMVAVIGGALGTRPCAGDDDCAWTEDVAAALSCPASGSHQDPPVTAHHCGCLCHVPGVPGFAPADVARMGPVDVLRNAIRDPLVPGVAEALFRPPRA